MGKNLVSIFLSKINVGKFADLIKKSPILSVPYKFISQRLISLDFPHHLLIETTNACNLKCKICARNLTPMKLGSMDFDLFAKILDEAKKYGPKTFSLHVAGEPLLDSRIIEKIKYIKKSDPKNTILLTTNGVLLTSNLAKGLVDNKVDKVAVSIHSPNANTYKEITGFDKLDMVEKNIKELIRIRKEAGAPKPKIYVRIIRIKDNFKEVEVFRNKWERDPVIIEIREEHNYGGKIEKNFSESKITKRYPCYHLWFSPGVAWDGEVSICCNDLARQAVIGNIKNNSLHEIWQSDALKKYREYHLNGEYHKISICENCDVWNIYPDIFFDWQKNKKKK